MRRALPTDARRSFSTAPFDQHPPSPSSGRPLTIPGGMPSEDNGSGGANGAAGEEDKDTWVQCDACKKWRRILFSLAEQLSDDSPW